jgi:hypothetical protein
MWFRPRRRLVLRGPRAQAEPDRLAHRDDHELAEGHGTACGDAAQGVGSMADMSELYTSSRLKVLRDCLRRHLYSYVLAIRMPATAAMEFGTVTHAALEAYFRAWMRGDMDARIGEALASIEASELPEIEKARISVIVAAYHARWGAEPWDILAVEAEFRYQLGGYTIGGKIDGLIRDQRDGRVYVLEHKTTRQDATPGSPYWERLAIDSQVSIYVDGAAMLGHEIAGCIYDVLKRPAHEQKLATPEAEREYTTGKGCKKCGGSAKAGEIVKGNGFYTVAFTSETKSIACDGCDGTGWKLDKEGQPEAPRLYARCRTADETIDEFVERVIAEIGERPDDFLIRNTVVRLDDELPRMRLDLEDTIRLERAAHLLFGAEPPRNPDACAKYGGLCPFFAACSGRADINDPHLFPRSTAHPELASAA